MRYLGDRENENQLEEQFGEGDAAVLIRHDWAKTARRVDCPAPWRPLPAGLLAFRHPGVQRQRVEQSAPLALERCGNDLVLLDPGLAAERLREHGRRVVVA